MMGAPPGPDRLHIHRLNAHYLLPADHPHPERLKARLDELARDALPSALARLVEPWAREKPGLCFIRQLTLPLAVNAAWEAEQVASQWAGQITRRLVMAFTTAGEDMVYFPDRAAYLARFLVDLAEGTAWGRWYYRTFEGLRALPTSTAIRTALSETPEDGLNALLSMDSRQAARVIDSMSQADAFRALQAMQRLGNGKDEAASLVALWQAWDTTLSHAQAGAASEAQAAFKLFLGTARARPELAGASLVRCALALLRLARLLNQGSRQGRQKLLHALQNGDKAALFLEAGTGDASVLQPLLVATSEWLATVGGRLTEHQQLDFYPDTTPGQLRGTLLGGLFLLLPFLDEFPVEQATAGWPSLDGLPPARLMRLLLSMKCLGREHAWAALHDPLLRDLLGIPPEVTPRRLKRWQFHLPPARLDSLLALNQDWHVQTGALSSRLRLLISLSRRGHRLGLVASLPRGTWLFAAPYRQNQPEIYLEKARPYLLSDEPSLIMAHSTFSTIAQETLPGIQVSALSQAAIAQTAQEEPAVAELAARIVQLPQDLDYLSLPPALRGPPRLDLALSVVAQGILRAFAWRLPGFAHSSLPYLFTNFLDFPASLEEEPARRIVRLGRPPLNLILNVTGLARRAYRLSWLDERPISLFQED